MPPPPLRHDYSGRVAVAVVGVVFIGLVVAAALILFLVAFVAPRRSRRAQGKVDDTLESAQRKAGEASAPLTDLASKSFGNSRKATNKSANAGRKSRFKLPF